MERRSHSDWLEFLRKAASLPVGYSVDDLKWFEGIAERDYPLIAPMISACIQIARVSDPASRNGVRLPATTRAPGSQDYDIRSALQSQQLFTRNSDLIKFAQQTLPELPPIRMDKMSRDEIVERVMRQVDQLEKRRKHQFESVLRATLEAMLIGPNASPSFLSKWQAVIKDL